MIFTAIGAIATAVGGFLSSTFLAGGIGAFLLRTAVGIGINFLASSIAGKDQEQPKFSIQGKLQAGDDQPRSFPLGKTATAGSLVYGNTWGDAGGTPNAYLTQVIALSDLPGCKLNAMWVNGVKVTLPDMTGTPPFAAGWAIPEYTINGGNHLLWIKYHDGNQTTADSFLTSKVSSADRPYGSTRVGRGVAYVVVTSQVNEEQFTGFPTFKFELSSVPLYDPSKDSSVGGSGAQRYADPATWGGDGDYLPAVQIYNLLRGLTYGGKWVYGLQNLPAARLPVAHWIAQIDKCRASITGPSGAEPQYRSGGFVAVNAPVADAVNAIQTACQGKLTEIGGTYKFPLGAPAAATWSFTDADILSTEEQSFTPFFGLADTINGVTAKYPSPDEAWNTKVAPPLYNSTYEAQDGNRRLLSDVSLDFVPYAGQVQRLMQAALNEARRARRHTYVLPPDFWGIEPGDTIAWTSNRNGYESKLFRVDGAADKANLDVTVDLTEVDPSDYDWDQEADYRTPVVGQINQTRPPAQAMAGWQVAPAIFYDDDGDERRPSIQVSYAGGRVDVDGIRVQVRLASTTAVVFDAELPYDAPDDDQYSVILNGIFLPDTDYDARGIYISASNRRFDWSAWLPVTTPDIRFGAADLYPIDLGQLSDDIGDYLAFTGAQAREFQQQLLALATSQADQDLGNFSDKQTLRRELVSTRDDITASYTEAIVVATGPGSALVARIEDLEVYVDDTVATAIDSLSAQITTVDGKTSANADAITALNVAMGGGSASVNVRMSASAGPAGYAARYGLEASVSEDGDFRSASMFIDVPSDPAGKTRVAFVADQFIITDGTDDAQPFVFTNGEAVMQNARIGTVTFDQLSSSNGKLLLKGSGSNASIEVFT